MASCSDMLDTKSDMVEFTEDNNLSTPQDTLYSVMGIIRKMQVIADRTVLLGEVRADLMAPTDKATTAIKNVAKFDFSTKNEYNQVSDYYAVINNCNYFIANCRYSTCQNWARRFFEKEFAAVKTYRGMDLPSARKSIWSGATRDRTDTYRESGRAGNAEEPL